MSRAKRLQRAGDIEGALAIYQRVLEQYPNNKAARRALQVASNVNHEQQASVAASGSKLSPDFLLKIQQLFDEDDYIAAISDLESVVKRAPHAIDCWSLLGFAYTQLGQYVQAANCFGCLCKLAPSSIAYKKQWGYSLVKCSRFEEAAAVYLAATKIAPTSAELFFLLGVALQNCHQPVRAKCAYTSALGLDPDYQNAHINLAVLLKEDGDFANAKEHLNAVLEADPLNALALSNLGSIYSEENRHEKAIDLYLKALDANPRHAQSFNNLGASYRASGKIHHAIECYCRAIELEPTYLDARLNLVRAYIHCDRWPIALEQVKRALQCDPESAEALRLLADILPKCTFTTNDQELERLILALLKKNFVRASKLSAPIASLVKSNPELRRLIQQDQQGQTRITLRQAATVLCRQELLLELMKIAPLHDLELENFLVSVRSEFLAKVDDLDKLKEANLLLGAMSLQCFTNEHVWPCTPSEQKNVDKLSKSIEERTRSKGPVPDCQILCLTLYQDLSKEPWVDELSLSREFTEVENALFTNTLHEEELAKKIESLSDISDQTSVKVRNQYERSPYPRWIQTALPERQLTIRELAADLQLSISSSEETVLDCAQPTILVAGSGTGQHAIHTAMRFRNCSVTAVDLSKSSLAYAIRKSAQLGVQNLHFFQADLLNLKQLQNNFAIIESVGVLHHLKDPMQGWMSLTSKLQPGGLMRIGLYSALARSHISKLRRQLDVTNRSYSLDEMKQIRSFIAASDHVDCRRLTQLGDFYSLSNFRDLLFHVQEHTFTIEGLRTCLSKLGLKFCGFEDKRIIGKFKQQHPGCDPADLESWDAFERTHPDTFIGMYQFLVRESTLKNA